MEEGLSTTKISYETGKRPKKVKRSGNYCCVANSQSTQYKVDNKANIKTSIVFFFIFQKTLKEERNDFKEYPDFGEVEGKNKFNVNNALICEFHFDPGDINVFIIQSKKSLKCNSVPTLEELKKPVVECKKKPAAAKNHFLSKLGSLCRSKCPTKLTKYPRLFALILITIKGILTNF